MKLSKMPIYILVLLLSSCGASKNAEESVLIYDPVKNKQFIHLLDEKGVNYRIQDDGLIFYPIDKNEIVKEAFEKVTGKKIPDLPPSPKFQ